ncbi:UDP-N-acetylmuramoyl-L-alanine--D-glutamate ligase [Neptunicella marina]|uniref:UDP-N-acetylmuramoylalanine--D-glutamate ligase n=1 Tax=Neptunicella marina TaxID=2125989 RepID=A0A8J6ITG9_9ALTE|nr:UDP-N-acetylmuramoyl-L-alanine--D-glutamate ligase [Neptunicella marina]MBC3765296.1 UDP-N-acetylmuramoyl-L-alanine--D-glutamate ligase [Neptunicella marina]
MSMQLAGKNIAVIGLGQTGLSAIAFLKAHHANVSAFDTRAGYQAVVPAGVVVRTGELDAGLLTQADMIVLSPGVALSTPAIAAAKNAGVPVLGDVEIFAQFNHVPVLAITGSNGKSTVTMLVAHMLEKAGKRVLTGGNIGVPVLDLLGKPADCIVLELSSFQLETTYSLQKLAATVLNVSDDHMDRYAGFDDYRDTKRSIYNLSQHCIVNRDDPATDCAQAENSLSFGLSASKTGFGFDQATNTILLEGKPWLEMQKASLAGMHNVLNIQAAAALASCTGAEHFALQAACTDFNGLPHRCERVSDKFGAQWINDSKATNVGATIAAIEGLRPQVAARLILIAGGDGKGADFTPLKSVFSSVDRLITLGRDGDKIAACYANPEPVSSLEQAVQLAAKDIQPGDMVLLSPACASLDMFKNYAERGQRFALAVEAL